MSSDGSQAEFATLIATRLDSQPPLTARVRWAQDSKMLPLKRGRWSVYAEGVQAGGRLELVSGNPTASKPVIVSIPWATESPDIVLTLEPSTSIVVRVPAVGGSPQFELAYVKLLPFRRGARPSLDDMSRARRARSVRIGDGCVLENWRPGTYRIGASWTRQGHIVADATILVVQGQIEVELPIPASAHDGFLKVRCFDPAGKPIEAASFRLDRQLGGGERGSSFDDDPLTREGVQLVELPAELLNAAPTSIQALELMAHHPEFGSTRQALALRQSTVDMHFREPARLQVAVAGIREGHEDRVRVQLVPQSGIGQSTAHGDFVPNTPNTWRFQDIEPGRYEVQAVLGSTDPDHPMRGWVLDREVLHIASGSYSHALEASALHTVSITAPDETPGTTVFLIPAGWRTNGESPFPPRFTLDKSKRAVIADIPPGTYSVRAGKTRGQLSVPGADLELER